ncbi:MAG: hypothetical protein K0Q95_3147 [Bacteroidota bacterium]|nr:hypothetical protein [Bacteroidota bacterium]
MSRSFGTKFFFIGLISTLAVSCNEESVVGLDVQPGSDLLNVKWSDTTTILGSTVREDSLHTDASIITTGDALIGTYIDPIFGKTSASLYTQMRLPGNDPDFGVNPVCDSVVLCLTYASDFYGKKDRKSQRISVHQLSDKMNTDIDYFSNNSIAYNLNDLANGFVYTPQPTKKVFVMGDSLKPHLRIPIESGFGTVILNQAATTNNLATTPSFQDFCPGLYITSDVVSTTPGDGNILHFLMGDLQSKVSIYYHNNAGDSLRYDLGFNSVGRFSSFNHHGYTTAHPYLYSQLTTSTSADTALYIQALAGTKAKLEFPHIMRWNDSGKIAVNKAELVIKVEMNPLFQKDTFSAPSKLVLFGISANNTNYIMPDALESNEVFDGTYNKATNEYHFNIARYIQQVLNGSRANTGLYLLASGGAVNANRVVVGSGSSKGSQKMKLNITYTKLH